MSARFPLSFPGAVHATRKALAATGVVAGVAVACWRSAGTRRQLAALDREQARGRAEMIDRFLEVRDQLSQMPDRMTVAALTPTGLGDMERVVVRLLSQRAALSPVASPVSPCRQEDLQAQVVAAFEEALRHLRSMGVLTQSTTFRAVEDSSSGSTWQLSRLLR